MMRLSICLLTHPSASGTEVDELSVLQSLQWKHRQHGIDSIFESGHVKGEEQVLVASVGSNHVCKTAQIPVSTEDECRSSAKQLSLQWRHSHKHKHDDDVDTDDDGDRRRRRRRKSFEVVGKHEGCYTQSGRVSWDPAYGREDQVWDIVCKEQSVPSENCFGKACVIDTFDTPLVDSHMHIATGLGVPAPLRGLWFMDGNAMPDSVLSFSADYEVVEGSNVIQGKMWHSSNIVALHDNEAGRNLYNLLEQSQPNYYHVVCQFGVNIDDITGCTISPSLFGLPPIPVQEPLFAWRMTPIPANHSNHIKEEDNPNEFTWQRDSVMFGSEHRYWARRIVDQHGRRLENNWNYFIQQQELQNHSRLGRIHNTGYDDEEHPFGIRVGLVAKALIGIASGPQFQSKMEFEEPAQPPPTLLPDSTQNLPLDPSDGPSPVTMAPVPDAAPESESANLDAIMQQLMTAGDGNFYNSEVPTKSEYESLVGLPGRCNTRNVVAGLERAMELGMAFGVNAGRDPTMAGFAAVLERLHRLITLDVWEQAYVAGGKQPINPVYDDFLRRDSPMPYPLSALLFTWYELLEVVNAFIALPLFQLPFHANGNRTYYFGQLAEQNCWEPMIFGSGTSVFKYDKVSSDMADPNQGRGYYMSAALMHRQLFNVDGPLFLSSGSRQHTDFREILVDVGFAQPWTQNASFWVGLMHQIPYIVAGSENAFGSSFNESGTNAKAIAATVFLASQGALWGTMPSAEEAEVLGPYITPASLSLFGDAAHNLITGVRQTSGEPSIAESLIGMRRIGLQFAKRSQNGQALVNNQLAQNYIEKYPGVLAAHPYNEMIGYNTEMDHLLLNMVDASMFAGYIGTNDLTTKCVGYQLRDESLKAMFEENPYQFIAELMRVDSAVTSFTSVYKEDTTEFFEGKEITFKAGTPYQSVLAAANRDPTAFESPNGFDPERSNLGDQLSWNGKLRHVESRDLEKAPRGCPGMCMSMRVGAAICASILGSYDKVKSKLSVTDDCSEFQNDCVGEWGEWSECSAECGHGFKTRTFQVLQAASGGGRACTIDHGTTETLACNVDPCPGSKCVPFPGSSVCQVYDSGILADQCPATVGFLLDVSTRVSYETLVLGREISIPLDPAAQALIPSVRADGVLLDPEILDQYSFATFVGSTAYAHDKRIGSDVPLPQIKQPIFPCFQAHGWCVPFVDPDSKEFTENATAAIARVLAERCSYSDMATWAFADDVNVEKRNKWSLILDNPNKPYQSQGMTAQQYIDLQVNYYFPDRRLGSGQVDWQQVFLRGGRLDDVTDHAIAFKHIGTHRVQAFTEGIEGVATAYKLDLTDFHSLQAREGLSRLGSAMYFDGSGFPVAVEIPERGVVQRDDADWDYAKFHWRSSLLAVVTLQDHLLGTHMACGHALAVASREELDASHPLRALMSRYTFGTIEINSQASNILLVSRSMLHRITPFADFGKALNVAIENPVPLNKFLEVMETQDTLLQDSPFVSDGKMNFDLSKLMVDQFFEQYGWCEGDSFSDAQVKQFAEKVGSLTNKAFVDVNAESCQAFKQDLAKLAFAVSGFHNHVGNVLSILEDPDIAGFAWFEGESRAPPMQFMLTVLLNHFTNHHHNPTLTQDYTHLCRDDEKCKSIFDSFKSEAHAISNTVQQSNTLRKVKVDQVEFDFPYVAFDPEYCEHSVTK